MTMGPGMKLGSYEILSPLGAGGMGEVYRARDTKLGREVAIKVLPEEFTQHPQKLARFEREARLLAALNHPKIATLYGVEDIDNQPLLIMELVEGQTLADRIARGAIPVEEALQISIQIAEALEAAHEKGVIHRDLKPANIKVDSEGNVKVLDFGLAKAFADEVPESELSQSPTLSRDATRAGVILGTAAYMSPEQAKGKTVDKRTDIFSFGIVLYEMLTGKKAFGGEDVPEVLAAIINKEPDWNAGPKHLDLRLDSLLRRCLRKDRKNRRQSIGDVRVELQDILADPHEARSFGTPMPGSGQLTVGAAVVAALLFGGVVAVAVWSLKPEPETVQRVARFVATAPSTEPLAVDTTTIGADLSIAITPDGTRIVYAVNLDGRRQLLVRALDQLEPTLLTGLGSAPRGPFHSPDGEWIGYFDGAILKKVSILGGPPVTICETTGASRGGSWGPDNTIIFATATQRGLYRVPAGGGEQEELAVPLSGEGNYHWPEFLPGGQAVLFTIMSASVQTAQIAVLSLATGEVKVLVPGGSNPRYVPTGHIVYGVGGTLLAVGFDMESLEVTSDPIPVLEGVVTKSSGVAEFAVAADGSLLYVAGSPELEASRTLVWVDRDGKEELLSAEPRAYVYPRISPDGNQVALDVRDQESDIWIWDFARETPRRLTFDAGNDWYPAWTPDGQRVAFASSRGGALNLFLKAADGTGTVERLTESDNAHYPYVFSPDGNELVYREIVPQRGGDFFLHSMDGSGEAEPLLATEFDERNAEISPNGRWLAYEADASGQYEIFVRPFPNIGEGSWQISRAGGTRPLWARDGEELFYLDAEGRLMSVPVRIEPAFDFGNPEVVIEQPYFATNGPPGRTYDVSPDGKRFLMFKEGGGETEAPPSELILVQNWHEELKRLVPTN